MSSLTVSFGGEIALPQDLRDRYGLQPGVAIRVVETRSGILLVPLTNEPMGEELARELSEWQALSSAAWDQFPYEDNLP